MKPLCYAAFALVLLIAWVALPAAQAQPSKTIWFFYSEQVRHDPVMGAETKDPMLFTSSGGDPVVLRSETDCPTYPLTPGIYYGWIDLAYLHPDDQWSFQPGDPVEVLEYEWPSDLAMALLRIDMKHYIEARIKVYYTADPVGWVTNLGNSRTNNGAGGDAGTNSFDEELWVIKDPGFDYELRAETNDYGYQTFPWGATARVAGLTVRNLLSEPGPTVVTYTVRDKSLRVSKHEIRGAYEAEFSGECVFRIDTTLWDPEANDGAGACNDGILWLGLNRVVDGTYRSGQGVEFAEIALVGQPGGLEGSPIETSFQLY
jgi:hypothetical protein